MIIKNQKELEQLRQGGRELALILHTLAQDVRPGMNAAMLEERAEQLIREAGGSPSFKGYRSKGDQRPYPAILCVSINDELVHALPAPDKIFQKGDLVKLDIGMRWPSGSAGLCTDTARTVGVGSISKVAKRLLQSTRKALDIGIAVIRPGIRTGDIGFAVEQYLKKQKLGVVKNLAGHGVGQNVHEEPLIPNYGRSGSGVEIVEGMVLAIEPMATLGEGVVRLAPDGWAYQTPDKKLAAHFEHTIVVVKNGVEIITKYP